MLFRSGELIHSRAREIVLAARSQMRFASTDLFGSENLRHSGFLIAQMDDIRVARRLQDSPVQKMCAHDVDLQARVDGADVHVHIEARCFSFELTLLPELVAQGHVQVSQQLLTLLAGDQVDIVIETENKSDAALIATQIEDICWSTNRLMNEG